MDNLLYKVGKAIALGLSTLTLSRAPQSIYDCEQREIRLEGCHNLWVPSKFLTLLHGLDNLGPGPIRNLY